MSSWGISFAIVLAVGAMPAAEPSTPAAASLMAELREGGAVTRVLWALEDLHRHDPDDLALLERLLRVRQFAAEELEGDRATEHFERNLEEGLRALSGSVGVRMEHFQDLHGARAQLTPSDVGLAYWATLSFGRTISSLSVFSRPRAAKMFRETLERLAELDGAYFHGAPYRALAQYRLRAPGFLGGGKKSAQSAALSAMNVDPDFAPNRVAQARVALGLHEDPNSVRDLLRATLSTEPHDEDLLPEHRRAQRTAAELLDELDA